MGGVFACKQLLLAFNAPAIATELTIVAYHAMARDEHGDWIAGTGAGNCSRCCRLPDSLGNLVIRTSLTYRNSSQGLPDLPLEGCCLDIKRHPL